MSKGGGCESEQGWGESVSKSGGCEVSVAGRK